MRHKMGYKKLNRTSEHRKALIKNMLNSLIKYEQITTTLPKAKVLKPQADKVITLGKKDTLSNTKTLISKLQDIKSTNKVKKKYLAIIKGHLKKTIKVNTLIDKNFINESKSFVNADNGKEAISSFKLKKLLNSACFVEIDIFTGRTHQIRVQSSHIGHPILNDVKYGDKNFSKTISPKKIKRMGTPSKTQS